MNNQIYLLIKKDKLLFSHMLGYMALYAFLSVAIMGMMGSFSSYPIILSAIFFSIGICSSVIYVEEESKSNLLAFTLPVSINDYLKARYLYFVIYPLKMILACSIIGMIINWLTVPEIRNIGLVIRYFHGYTIAISIAIILPSIYLPLSYILGASKSRIIFSLIAGFSTMIASPIVMDANINITSKMFIVPIIFIICSMFVCYISYRISIKKIRSNTSF